MREKILIIQFSENEQTLFDDQGFKVVPILCFQFVHLPLKKF